MRRLAEWRPDAAHRRACAALTNAMPSAVCAPDATLTDLVHDLVLVRPNVRAKRVTTVARRARAVENATAPRTGPGGLPLALRLSEGLGISSWDTLKRMDLHARDSASRSALPKVRDRAFDAAALGLSEVDCMVGGGPTNWLKTSASNGVHRFDVAQRVLVTPLERQRMLGSWSCDAQDLDREFGVRSHSACSRCGQLDGE